MNAKPHYKELTQDQHRAVLKKIGPVAEKVTQVLTEMAGGQKEFFDTFVVKVYQCGQATYRMPESKIIGQWKNNAFSLTKFEKGKEVDKQIVGDEKKSTVQDGPDLD